MSRKVLFVVHTGRQKAVEVAKEAADGLTKSGIEVINAEATPEALSDLELVMVFGGDGTILRGVEIARAANIPVLGVNLGHVGFLAEAEAEEVNTVIETVVNHSWIVEERTALSVTATDSSGKTWSSWALNEIAVERAARGRMANLLVSIDHKPLSQWACDGVLLATPTGSTAYAFSSGGPVVWPEVEALLVVPLSAHALFNRPIVVSPKSVIEVTVQSDSVIVSADGRRDVELSEGGVIKVVRNQQPVQFARIQQTPFTERLVAKFELPVQGFQKK